MNDAELDAIRNAHAADCTCEWCNVARRRPSRAAGVAEKRMDEVKPTPEQENTRLLMVARSALRERLAHLATLNEDDVHFAVSAQAARTAKALAILDGAF